MDDHPWMMAKGHDVCWLHPFHSSSKNHQTISAEVDGQWYSEILYWVIQLHRWINFFHFQNLWSEQNKKKPLLSSWTSMVKIFSNYCLQIDISRLYKIITWLPACTWQVLKNQYSEPNPRSFLHFYNCWLCLHNDKEYRAFEESERHGYLDLYRDYWFKGREKD